MPSAMLSTRYCLSNASAIDREHIHRIRHQVYATELGQHAENDDRRLDDALDAVNEYLVVRDNGGVVGFISITPPGERGYSVDKYFPRAKFSVPSDNGLYEVRLLTVLAEHRGSSVAALLVCAAKASRPQRARADVPAEPEGASIFGKGTCSPLRLQVAQS